MCFEVSEGPRWKTELGLPCPIEESVLQDEKSSEGEWLYNSVNVVNNVKMYM